MRISGGRRVAVFILIGLTVVIALAVGITLGFAVASVRNTTEIARSAELESALPTVLLDRNGRVITQLYGEEKRTLVSIEELPRHLISALITREDQAFFQHNGVNPWRIIAAGGALVLDYISGGRWGYFSGASTITQQLAKIMYTDQSLTIRRKLQEVWWALQLERHLTKFEILEEYLNRMPFGHGTYGIEAASEFYFGHPASELTIAESVMLVLQLSSPGYATYSPFANPENAMEQQQEILRQMVELGYATQEEVDASFEQYWANHDFTRTATTSPYLERLKTDQAPWFTEHVLSRLQEELLLGSANIYTDGYTVHTTLDLDYQEVARRRLWEGLRNANATYRRNQENNEIRIERFIPMIDMLGLAFDVEEIHVGTYRDQRRAANYFREELSPLVDMLSMTFDSTEQDALRQITRRVYQDVQEDSKRTTVEGALITLENQTGHILAMVGGSQFAFSNQNNRAITAMRPPGSSFKPLYYSAGIQNGAITAATMFNDARVIFPNDDGTLYVPENYNGEWRGPTRARYALAKSMNVVSLKVLQRIGFPDALSNAGRLLGLNETEMAERGFEPRYPVGLGTVAVSPILMARAFATFPSGGREVIPNSVLYIEDRRGRTILEPYRDIEEQLVRKGNDAQLLSPQAAWIMVDILQDTVEYGTLMNRRILVGGFGDMPMAGKTGTTQNWSDAWTVGFSPYMTTAVWLGFDRGEGNSLGTNQTGAQTAGPIWAWYMKEIHENLPPIEFERPPGIVERVVTERSGLLPTEDYRGATYTDYFIAGTEPTEFDTMQDFYDDQREQVVRTYSRHLTPATTVSRELRARSLLDLTLQNEETSQGGSEGVDTNPFFDEPADEGDTDEGAPGSVPPPEPVIGTDEGQEDRTGRENSGGEPSTKDGEEEETGSNPMLD
jgi:penicillin-binding protein 1A